ncbi:hypothetical protein K2X14_14575 [Acetobacter sp. TBRC 12305]|uniref:DUF5983 domain-containing protein n=1 Tax=Acetobacter garciniae TaxID=2817435 RepID=A0A939KR28_9PROT|nr:hypothetical protein [Acetobacter garciniae]MBO1326202.1 hypothetical protein [Acetobacter garciniae]MBX0346061.1 hypothetical protein [Acetobacter garciniae]
MSAVRQFLDLSTGHLPRADRDRLAVWASSRIMPFGIMPGPFGWFMHVPENAIVPEWEGTDALPRIFAHARAQACDYVLLDADGPRDDALPWFDED